MLEGSSDYASCIILMLARLRTRWGTAGIDGIWGKDGTFNTTELRNETLLNTDAYAHAAAAWAEQRSFGELAVVALEEVGHPMAKAARAEVDLVEKGESSPYGN